MSLLIGIYDFSIFMTAWVWLAMLFGIFGIITGITALSRIKKDPTLKGRGLAITGIIFSALMVTVIAFFIWFLFRIW